MRTGRVLMLPVLVFYAVTASVTITGELTLTDTRFKFTQTTKIEIDGIPQIETDSDQGTYSTDLS